MLKANWIIHIGTKVVATTNMPTVILKNNLNTRHLTFVEKARSHFHTVVWIIHLDQNDTLPSQAIQSKYSFDFFPHRINLSYWIKRTRVDIVSILFIEKVTKLNSWCEEVWLTITLNPNKWGVFWGYIHIYDLLHM